MTATPTPPTVIDAPNPTSRAVFRTLVKALGATNREADDLRLELLGRSTDSSEPDAATGLVAALRAMDAADPTGARGAEARLAVWFSHAGNEPDAANAEPSEVRARFAEAWAATTGVREASMQEVARLVRLTATNS